MTGVSLKEGMQPGELSQERDTLRIKSVHPQICEFPSEITKAAFSYLIHFFLSSFER